MTKQDLLEQLRLYMPKTKQEDESKEKMTLFLQQYDNCFDRSFFVGHMTASCWLVNKDNTKALLMHHAKLDRWLQLGGHCDGDEDVLQVALKEAKEESGIIHIIPVSKNIFDLDVHLIPANQTDPAHYHYDVRFLLCVTSDEKVIQNNESKELRWIGKEKSTLPTKEASVVRMFDKWVTYY